MKQKPTKVRNHVALALAKRNTSGAAGAHGTTTKAKRVADRVRLQNEVDELYEEEQLVDDFVSGIDFDIVRNNLILHDVFTHNNQDHYVCSVKYIKQTAIDCLRAVAANCVCSEGDKEITFDGVRYEAFYTPYESPFLRLTVVAYEFNH